MALYGFLREAERSLFRTVQKVSGIGAKIALAILSGARWRSSRVWCRAAIWPR